MLIKGTPYRCTIGTPKNITVSSIKRYAAMSECVQDNIKHLDDESSHITVTKGFKFCIFLDDERHITDVTWVEYPTYWSRETCRTYDEFKKKVVERLNLSGHPKDTINYHDFSFDHDIQCFDSTGNEKTGYDCVKWLCEYLMDNGCDMNRLSYVVHSKNPVGVENITKYIENCKSFQNANR